MTTFNQFYYSFSPAVADFEREQPLFKEVMKVTLTPMLSSLSLLNHVDIDSEQEMLGYGISIVLLNHWNVCWNSCSWNSKIVPI